MLFGYIKDFSIRYNYIDLKTNKVFKSFDSDLKRVQWLRNLSLESLLIVSKEMKLEEIKVPWYENNFELVKLVFPFIIVLYFFIGY